MLIIPCVVSNYTFPFNDKGFFFSFEEFKIYICQRDTLKMLVQPVSCGISEYFC